MPFEEIEIDPGAGRPSARRGTGLRISLRGEVRKANLTVRAETARQIGWANGDKLVVYKGTGADSGRIRLQKNNSVGRAVAHWQRTKDNGFFSILLGPVPFAPKEPAEIPPSDCLWEIVAPGTVDITLPMIWTIAEPSVVATRPATPNVACRPGPDVMLFEASGRPGAGRGHPAAPQNQKLAPLRVDRTAALLGDPPPERSAAKA